MANRGKVDLTLCKSYLLNQEASCKSLSHNSLEIKEKDILQGLKKAIWRIGDVIQWQISFIFWAQLQRKVEGSCSRACLISKAPSNRKSTLGSKIKNLKIKTYYQRDRACSSMGKIEIYLEGNWKTDRLYQCSKRTFSLEPKLALRVILIRTVSDTAILHRIHPFKSIVRFWNQKPVARASKKD